MYVRYQSLQKQHFWSKTYIFTIHSFCKGNQLNVVSGRANIFHLHVLYMYYTCTVHVCIIFLYQLNQHLNISVWSKLLFANTVRYMYTFTCTCTLYIPHTYTCTSVSYVCTRSFYMDTYIPKVHSMCTCTFHKYILCTCTRTFPQVHFVYMYILYVHVHSTCTCTCTFYMNSACYKKRI